MKADDLLKLSQTTLEEILDSESKSTLQNVSNTILTAPQEIINEASERNLKRKEIGFGDTDSTVFDNSYSNGSPDMIGKSNIKSNSKIMKNGSNNGSSSGSKSKSKSKKRKISMNHSMNSADSGRMEGGRDGDGDEDHLHDEDEDEEEEYMSEEDSMDEFRSSAHKGRGRGSSSPNKMKSKQSETALIDTSNLSASKNQSLYGMAITQNGAANNSNNSNNHIISSSSSTLLLDLGTNSSDKPYGGQGEHGEESQLEYLEESFQLIALMVRGNAARIKDDMK